MRYDARDSMWEIDTSEKYVGAGCIKNVWKMGVGYLLWGRKLYDLLPVVSGASTRLKVWPGVTGRG